uniref:HTH La-type RNA-binding domain-containing protein n=1 Tax=Vombatus ursinus TaxID=29139 RepID=A0A4X2LEF3_VOMUR
HRAWPGPRNNECRNVTNQPNKKPQSRKEKEEKIEKRVTSDSKENLEAKLDGPGESKDEAQSNNQRKRANKHNKRDDQDEVSSVRSEGGNIRGCFRGRGRGHVQGRGRGRGNPGMNFEYFYDYGEQHGERTDQPFQTELNTSMMCYYDDRQIKYYFNIENLEQNFFLRRKMDEQGILPITLIAGFHCVQALTTNVNFILESLKQSTEVEVVDQNIREKVEPEKWPIPDPLLLNMPQTDFSQLIHCPEFILGKAFGSHIGNSFSFSRTKIVDFPVMISF